MFFTFYNNKNNNIIVKYAINKLLCTKLINNYVCVSEKFAKNFLPNVCAQDFKYSIILTRTSHLTADLSYTRAPSHLIEALRATTGWS